MKKYPGDLIDMIRATGEDEETEIDGEFPMNFPGNPDNDLADPFTHSKDPLLYDLVSEFLMSSSHSVNDRASVDVLAPLINPAGGSKPSEKLPMVTVPPAANSGISSPQNPGSKRRKSQKKKVVCIPAPASPPKNRPGAEIVPSDLWSWRKYGQKPIKGSPYPRGYYKCSSSKGCSARKQVERSRKDPNMLVITYTAEHNHPWLTQRNSIMGSTRWKTKSPRGLKEPPPAIKEEVEHTKIDLEGFSKCHKPTLTHSSQFEGNFLADFHEIETISMDALFDDCGKRPFDPFSLCDWNESGGATTSTSLQNKGSSNDFSSALDQMHNTY